MASANQKVFYVHENARSQIPREIKVFKTESRPSNGFFIDAKWTKEFTSYKLKSISPAVGYSGNILEVVYEMIDET